MYLHFVLDNLRGHIALGTPRGALISQRVKSLTAASGGESYSMTPSGTGQ